jgi:hypothetical protein
MDPVTMAIIGAAVQALIGGGIAAATPKHGMTQPLDAPKPGQSGGMDFSALVGQQQPSNLPKLQLQNRMPQGY